MGDKEKVAPKETSKATEPANPAPNPDNAAVAAINTALGPELAAALSKDMPAVKNIAVSENDGRYWPQLFSQHPKFNDDLWKLIEVGSHVYCNLQGGGFFIWSPAQQAAHKHVPVIANLIDFKTEEVKTEEVSKEGF